MFYKTTIIRPVTSEEQQQLRDELSKNNDLWEPHGSGKHITALDDGLSIHLNSVLYGKFEHSWFDRFPLTHNILKSVAGERTIARTYWHKLECGDTIFAHDDRPLYEVVHDRLDNRYQIYLDCPDNEITIDCQSVNAKTFENSVVNLGLLKTHSYVNNSSAPWLFLVFDVLKPGINLL